MPHKRLPVNQIIYIFANAIKHYVYPKIYTNAKRKNTG